MYIQRQTFTVLDDAKIRNGANEDGVDRDMVE